MGILECSFIIWLSGIFIAICCLASEKWHNKAKLYLCWSLFPFPLIFRPRKMGYLKSWLLFLVSPFMIVIYWVILMALILSSFSDMSKGQPYSIPYHTKEDLRRISGVEFPEVIPVDSGCVDDCCLSETIMKFVPDKPLDRRFFHKLDKACKEDPCCWSKDSLGYRYYIYPELPIDRPNGTHIRQVEVDGKMVDDWDGNFIEVRIPYIGDTIYVKDGWIR